MTKTLIIASAIACGFCIGTAVSLMLTSHPPNNGALVSNALASALTLFNATNLIKKLKPNT